MSLLKVFTFPWTYLSTKTIFHEIMDKVSEYQNTGTFRGKYQALKKGIKNVFDSHHGTINLNLLISDGNMLYAFNHYSSWFF